MIVHNCWAEMCNLYITNSILTTGTIANCYVIGFHTGHISSPQGVYSLYTPFRFAMKVCFLRDSPIKEL